MFSKLKLFFSAALFAMIMLTASISHAALADLNYMTPNDSSGTTLSSYSLSTAVTTEAIKTRDNLGYSSLVLALSGGSVTVSYELSLDGTNWYAPYTTDGSTLTSVSTVVSNLGSSSWIVLTARLTNYVRFKITPTGGSPTISVKYMYQAGLSY